MNDDKEAIDSVIRSFFAVFTNTGGTTPELDRLHELCLPECTIVKTCGRDPEIYSISDFIEPREALLNGGGLVDFVEREIEERTDIFGDIAQRLSIYQKSGVLEGQPFSTRGLKTFQLIRTSSGWKISAAAWDDERPGLTVRL